MRPSLRCGSKLSSHRSEGPNYRESSKRMVILRGRKFGVLLLGLALACGQDGAVSQQGDEPREIREAKLRATQDSLLARKSRVSRIVVYPGDVSVQPGQAVQLAAAAFDSAGTSLVGIAFHWTAVGSDGTVAAVDTSGLFEVAVPGSFTVTATEESGHSGRVVVTVSEGGVTPLILSQNPPGTPDYNPAVGSAVFLPINRRRPNPADGPTVATHGGGPISVPALLAGSGDANLEVPLLATPGRGLDTNLTLYYSAKVWTVFSSEADFDVDGEWPAPGFTLSFGKVINTGSGVIYIDARGVRHPFQPQNAGLCRCTLSYYTTDGSLIDYSASFSFVTPDTTQLTSATVKHPDGTVLTFSTMGPSSTLYATKITDKDGNYITITYVNNAGPNLMAIVDSLGRSYTFTYDSNGNLKSITGPAPGGTRTIVSFHYSNKPISRSFALSSITVNGGGTNNTRWLLDAIVLPDGTGFSMGDLAANYSPYGMIRKAEQRVGMSIDGSGNVNRGTLRRSTQYEFPSADASLTSAPTYLASKDWWANSDTGEVSTGYVTQSGSGTKTTTMTQPDGSKVIRVANDDSNSPDYGLTTSIQLLAANGSTLRTTTYTYVDGYHDTSTFHGVRNLKEVVVKDFGAGGAAPRRTVYTYGSTDMSQLAASQLAQVDEYDFDQVTVLRTTQNLYVTDANYASRHIYNLVSRRTLLQSGVARQRTDYAYDAQRGQALANTLGVVQHAPASDPYSVQYSAVTDYRGNVTSITRYANAAAASGALTSSLSYDITGNVVTTTDETGVLHQLVYSSNYQYGYLTSTTTGTAPASIATTSTYDASSGLVTSTTDATGRSIAYDFDLLATLRLRTVTYPTGAQEIVSYNAAALNVTTQTTYQGAILGQVSVTQNGLGTPYSVSIFADGAGTVDNTQLCYDSLGRLSKRSLPYRSGSYACSGTAPVWTRYAYDGLGRQTSVTAPDGASATWEYQPTFVAAGQPSVGVTVLETNPWKAERWLRYDALGRMAASYEAKNATGPQGTVAVGGILTTYAYDALDNLTYASVAGRNQSFVYDGLSRLIAQRLAERNATLDSAGTYVGAGSYSDVFIYDAQGRLVSATDARGVVTSRAYENGGLSRLLTVSYDIGHVGDTAHPVSPVGAVGYTYCTTNQSDIANYCPHNDVRAVRHESVTGGVTKDYFYDLYGRTTTVQTHLASRGSYPLAVDYGYDALSRQTSTTYPTQYGFGTEARKNVGLVLDSQGRPKSLTVGTTPHAQNVTYDANGGMHQALLGVVGVYQASETWDYEPISGLLQHQQVLKQGDPANNLDLKYDYTLPGTDAALGRMGKVTSITNVLDPTQRKDKRYTYDSLGRIRSVAGGPATPAWTQTYGYDDNGNRLTVSTSGSVVPDGLTSLVYDSQNRISGYEYDNAGNLIQGNVSSGVTERYQYDAAGRLVTVTRLGNPNVTLETYSYGTDRIRLSMTDSSGAKTYYVTDGSRPIAEYSDNGTKPVYARAYMYLGSRLISALKPSGSTESLEVYHFDSLGRRLIGTSSSVREQVSLPFGNELDAESTTWTRHYFTSYERSDTTKLDYARNRFYSPGQGRFTQPDPLGIGALSAGRSQSLNLYEYALDDPENNVDPSGTSICLKASKGASDGFCTGDGFFTAFLAGGGGAGGYWGWTGVFDDRSWVSLQMGQDTVWYYAGGFSRGYPVWVPATAGSGVLVSSGTGGSGPDPKSEELRAAVNAALARLNQRKSCQVFFRTVNAQTSPQQALAQLVSSRNIFPSTTTPAGDAFAPGEAARTGFRGSQAVVAVNVNEAFYNQRKFARLLDASGRPFSNINQTQFQILTVLHELVHVIDPRSDAGSGRYDDISNMTKSDEISGKVKNACGF
jgi:RHS repeat-associated protein